MASVNNLLETAVQDGTAPGLVVFASDKSGKLNYSKAFSPQEGTLYSLDTVFEISSMSKFPTSVAAMQLVEKGLITLDEDVSRLVPTLAEQGVLVSVAEDGTPAVRPRQNPLTLRRLISHSAGPGYFFLDKRLGKIRAARKKQSLPTATVSERFDEPLLYEPGEGFAYGTGLDWVGHIVETLSGLTLDEYMKKNIWEPLGADSTTFFPDENPGISARRVSLAVREKPDGPAVEKPGMPTASTGLKVCLGGHGIFASMSDFSKLLHSLLVDDEKLLKKETAALMFQPQLTPASKEELQLFMDTPDMKMLFPSPPIERDFGLGGLLIVGDGHEYWSKGTMMWGGAANVNFFIDRTAGVCGVFGSQVLPPGDPRVRNVINAFHADVYRSAGKLKASLEKETSLD